MSHTTRIRRMLREAVGRTGALAKVTLLVVAEEAEATRGEVRQAGRDLGIVRRRQCDGQWWWYLSDADAARHSRQLAAASAQRLVAALDVLQQSQTETFGATQECVSLAAALVHAQLRIQFELDWIPGTLQELLASAEGVTREIESWLACRLAQPA